MGESWLGVVIGMFVLVIAATGVIAHYRREYRRAELLRNLDHHDWCPWSRPGGDGLLCDSAISRAQNGTNLTTFEH
ncbi:hypothetical protein LMG28727_01413 [Paraburkholderia kirstenboschensis]|uniref:hypothetical protein n=1 Tax=Paraburkholderia kirstenboschensis TaxID=1245436 RepID=UPI000A508174|nr:hypothetical protein [Paraburkholderia kirstenboschensis]CAD6520485.1 hypothetical protein LMG28727_01413 [Paraburkholderia kirstenboschensis]